MLDRARTAAGGESCALEGSRAPCEQQSGHVAVACRGYADGSAWVVARREGSKQLLVAMESVPDTSLGGAMAHAQKLVDASVPGTFV